MAASAAFRPAIGASPLLLSKKIPSSGESLPIIGLGTWQTFDVGENAAARAQLAEVLKLFAGASAGTDLLQQGIPPDALPGEEPDRKIIRSAEACSAEGRGE